MKIPSKALRCGVAAAFLGLLFLHNAAASDGECDARQWMDFPIAGAPQGSQKLGADRFLVLKGEARAVAVGKLKAAPFYEPSADELQKAGLQSSAHDGFRMFFTRAVAMNVAGGSWLLRQDGTHLFIEYGVLTRNPVTPVCAPLAIMLKDVPGRVFVHAGAAG
jgi:hypothetical protein